MGVTITIPSQVPWLTVGLVALAVWYVLAGYLLKTRCLDPENNGLRFGIWALSPIWLGMYIAITGGTALLCVLSLGYVRPIDLRPPMKPQRTSDGSLARNH